MRQILVVLFVVLISKGINCQPVLSANTFQAESWMAAYSGNDSQGSHVIGHWQFEATDPLKDAGPLGLNGTFDGAVESEGKFGGGIESFAGWPIRDKHHAFVVPDHPALSPASAFTVEMWLQPKAEIETAKLLYLVDKKYASQNDFQWFLGTPTPSGARRMTVVLGFGEDIETYATEPLMFPVGEWQHVAFSYDGAGTVRFFHDGSAVSTGTKPGRFGVAAGRLPLSIGDRVGSNYGGFPGLIDEVRITTGVRDFSPFAIEIQIDRKVWIRNEQPSPQVSVNIRNLRNTALKDVQLEFLGRGWSHAGKTIADFEPGTDISLQIAFDTSLRPDDYHMTVRATLPGEKPITSTESLLLKLQPRPLPYRMPVMMWGIAGPAEVEQELPRLKQLGFNQCLGFSPSPQAIWAEQKVIPVDTPARVAEVRNMLDLALANDFEIAVSLYAGSFLKGRPELSRVDREGKPYARQDCNAALPGLAEFSENYGRSVGQLYGDHPALTSALINSEVRDTTNVSFSEFDRKTYHDFAGTDIPAEVTSKIGPTWTTLPDFPKNRVLPDDDPLLTFYRWFWTTGDGWNNLHTALHRGLKEGAGRDEDLWTWYDPAIRVPSIGGSGGEVDVLSQWTYTEPSPLRVGYFCDELFAMSEASGKQQDVMKMTQLFWYRSSSAPKKAGSNFIASPFDDHDPDAAYISIAPMHLRGSFWTKIARPIKGVMYHGWSSLVTTDGTHAYKYTHADLQTEFQRLHREIIEPLGPTLLQVPDRPADVAYLESFTSQMFARRGSYGYSHDEAYLTLLHAQLQPEIIYEETLLKRDLNQFKLLVLADCDVLTASVVAKILAFQKDGGLIIGDSNLTPAIKPDILLPKFVRTKKTDQDQAKILAHAAELRQALAGRYEWYTECSTPEIVTRVRSAGASDYVFAVNDHREFGDYVGQYGLVLEQGVPSRGEFRVSRKTGHVYDLLTQSEVPVQQQDDHLSWTAELGPCAGKVYLVTPKQIANVSIVGPKLAGKKQSVRFEVSVTDAADQPISAVIPMQVEIIDPAGRVGEFSGFYGAADGQLQLNLDIAINDRIGVWQVRVHELASGNGETHYFRVVE